MDLRKIEQIIVKYFTNEASFQELDELENWLIKDDNQEEFLNFVKINFSIDYSLKKSDTDKTKDLIKTLLQNEKKRIKIKRLQHHFKYAAILVGLLGSIYVLKNEIIFSTNKDETPAKKVIRSNTILPGSNKATLMLDDGSIINLEKGEKLRTTNADSDGEQLVYHSKPRENAKVHYNYLTIPRGGQFNLILADGTEVWLNSESQLKYPVSFDEGVDRIVELIYGEAYFDVSPSTQNKGAGFTVINFHQEVQVLGTEFNIKAYRDDNNIYTTLVEGKVTVNSEGIPKKLVPGQQSDLNIEQQQFSVNKVDVNAETAWRKGIFSFKGKPLKDIMKVISRWYDVDVVFENKKLETITFRGILGKNQNLEEVLETIKSLSIIKNYEIYGKQIILK